MNVKTSVCCLFIGLVMLATDCRAQPIFVKETDTPIALHYAQILKDYAAFITSKLGGQESLVGATQVYFNRLGYRVVSIRIQHEMQPGINESWRAANTKLAVLPRIICTLSAGGSTVKLYDQGDDFILLQNNTGDSLANPGLYVAVGITHQWK